MLFSPLYQLLRKYCSSHTKPSEAVAGCDQAMHQAVVTEPASQVCGIVKRLTEWQHAAREITSLLWQLTTLTS